MCEPATLTAIGTSIFGSAGAATAGAAAAGAAAAGTAATSAGVLGTGLSAFQVVSLAATAGGALMQYQGTKSAEASAIATGRANAAAAEKAAGRELVRGQEQAEQIGRDARALKGSQRATLAARGLDLGGDGSVSGALDQTDFFGLEDQKTSIRNSQEDAAAYGQQAANYRSARSNSAAGFGTLLGGAAAVADKWYKYRG